MAGQQFFNFCELFILRSYSSQFIFFELFTYAVTVSNFSELFSSAAAYVFCEGYWSHDFPFEFPETPSLFSVQVIKKV